MTKETTTPMHTDTEIKQATARVEQLAATLTLEDFEDATDLRTIAQAADAVQGAQARLREAVSIARLNGRSWGQIGIALGISRQAAHERFADKSRA